MPTATADSSRRMANLIKLGRSACALSRTRCFLQHRKGLFFWRPTRDDAHSRLAAFADFFERKAAVEVEVSDARLQPLYTTAHQFGRSRGIHFKHEFTAKLSHLQHSYENLITKAREIFVTIKPGRREGEKITFLAVFSAFKF